ncbi:Cytochrome c oxidase assembly factor 3 [Yarrowia sp. B02]|nr:Cytochrome c oxidase assembly factor 3 [Yarrowia sp. B02]
MSQDPHNGKGAFEVHKQPQPGLKVFRKGKYIDPKTFQMSPALIRARRPFFVRNMLALAGLTGFVAGIYGYTMYSLRTDDFSDVPIPPLDPEEIKKLQSQYKDDSKA